MVTGLKPVITEDVRKFIEHFNDVLGTNVTYWHNRLRAAKEQFGDNHIAVNEIWGVISGLEDARLTLLTHYDDECFPNNDHEDDLN